MTESNFEEQLRTALNKQFGFLPEEIDAIQEFLKTNRSILRFYLNEYSLHLSPQQQVEISELARQSDLMTLKTARIQFQAKNFENETAKTLLGKKNPVPDQKTLQEFKKQITEMQNGLLQLNKRVSSLIEEFEPKPASE